MQARKNIYMLMKEAVNNAVKYSGGAHLFLSIHRNLEGILVEIRDDGKGFDHTRSYEGNGLKNMHSRATDLGAELTIDSSPGGGTLVRLQYHIHHSTGQPAVFHPGGGQAGSH
jgi:signal transduction histidine kinase